MVTEEEGEMRVEMVCTNSVHIIEDKEVSVLPDVSYCPMGFLKEWEYQGSNSNGKYQNKSSAGDR